MQTNSPPIEVFTLFFTGLSCGLIGGAIFLLRQLPGEREKKIIMKVYFTGAVSTAITTILGSLLLFRG